MIIIKIVSIHINILIIKMKMFDPSKITLNTEIKHKISLSIIVNNNYNIRTMINLNIYDRHQEFWVNVDQTLNSKMNVDSSQEFKGDTIKLPLSLFN